MKPSFYENVRIYFKQYCNRSSVHGFQYFGEKRRTIFERIWWVMVFILCLSTCGYCIHEVYKKWDQSPVIVNFANSGTPIYKIPFPAVTICPESKVDENKFNYIQMKKYLDKVNYSMEQYRNFEYISLLCNHLSSLNISLSIDPQDFFNSINYTKPEFNMKKCSYFNKDCKDQFVPIITEEGICYTFNMIDRSQIFREGVNFYEDFLKINKTANWTLTSGYEDNKLDTYPRRAYLAGAKNGLIFQIRTPKRSRNYACKTYVKGYKVVLHTPTTIPRPSQKFFRISLHQNIVGAVQPTIITTSERVKKYNPKKRKCYFGIGERSLGYFREYTSSNCRVECLTNYTLKFCGCVNYYMPRRNDTVLCGTEQIKCMKEAEKIMQRYELDKNLPLSKNKSKTIEEGQLDCDCMPICSDLTYVADTTQTDWNPPNTKHDDVSSVTLYFKSDDFLTSERNELYGPIDFLANFGGLIGLFSGFSILSFMEILYFLTIRIITNRRLYGKWTGPGI